MRLPAIALAALVMTTVSATAQSLADVARQEEARRKAVKAGKVYTNDTLRPDTATATPPSAPAPGPAAAAPAPSGAQATTPAEKPADADDPKKTEKYWRDRMAQLRDSLQRAKMFQDALQSRINALTTDFAARDDPAQRDTISGDRQKALAELDRVKKEIAGYEKQVQDIEDEARKAGVPPGWLR